MTQMRPVRLLPETHPVFYFSPCGEGHDSKATCTANRILSCPSGETIFLFAGAETDVVIRVRRRVVQVEIEHTSIRSVVEVATAQSRPHTYQPCPYTVFIHPPSKRPISSRRSQWCPYFDIVMIFKSFAMRIRKRSFSSSISIS